MWLSLTKVTVYLDDEVWGNFKTQVFKKHGSLRKLSYEVERILRNETVDDEIASTFKKLGIPKKETSSKEIREKRPTLKGPPSEEIISAMRHKRVA